MRSESIVSRAEFIASTQVMDITIPGTTILAKSRVVGMSLNLSREVYSGGVLQIRNRESEALISEAANTGSGDAVIFRLSRDLAASYYRSRRQRFQDSLRWLV